MDTSIRFPDIKPLNIRRYAKIVAAGVGLPEKVVTNQDIIDRYNVIATDRAVEYSLGIKERRWVDIDQKLDDLMAKAVKQCLERAGMDINQVSRVIYTRLLGDYQIPAASVSLLRNLGAAIGIPAFDISSACSGFMHAMDLAIRYIASGDLRITMMFSFLEKDRVPSCRRLSSKESAVFGLLPLCGGLL